MIDVLDRQRQGRFLGGVDLHSKLAQGLSVAVRVGADAPLKHVEGDVILDGEDPEPRIESPRSCVAVKLRESRGNDEKPLFAHGRLVGE